MEELGIGRPSTLCQYRDHHSGARIRPEGYKTVSFPEDKGRIVTIFLLNFFQAATSGTTSPPGLEDQLDDVSAGQGKLQRGPGAVFWRDFTAAIAETSELRITRGARRS